MSKRDGRGYLIMKIYRNPSLHPANFMFILFRKILGKLTTKIRRGGNWDFSLNLSSKIANYVKWKKNDKLL